MGMFLYHFVLASLQGLVRLIRSLVGCRTSAARVRRAFPRGIWKGIRVHSIATVREMPEMTQPRYDSRLCRRPVMRRRP